MDTSKLDTTPFPADVAEMVLNKGTRHPSLQCGPVFIDSTLTDNGDEHIRYRLSLVGDQTVDGKTYVNLVLATPCKDMRDIAAKLRDGYFTEADIRKAAEARDAQDAAAKWAKAKEVR